MTAIVWLRRDLRVHDHPALRAALDAGGDVVPVFCFDDRLLKGRHSSGPRTQFLLECLDDLRRALRERGGDLVLRRGRPERELPALARELEASTVHVSADAGPFARRRDERVRRALWESGARLVSHPGTFAIDDLDAVRTAGGRAFTVFSPFHCAWLRQPRRALAPTPRSLPALPRGVGRGTFPRLTDLGPGQRVADPPRGGERPAREAMRAFVGGPVRRYGDDRDALGDHGVSRLSPYLRFGCVSPRELEQALPRGTGAEAYRRQLCWRDFFAHVMASFPRNAHSEHQPRYRGALRWSRARRRFDAWREGRTGYPLVDAGMRQLRREGYMHNRARLVAASFLTKDLWIDWRWGERWFMRLLVDGDQASNNGNWQWIASVGVDSQPPFRRILNPTRQQRRFDAGGDYVRRHVPELEAVPDQYLAEPWKMPPELQREVGCVIGRDYPEPIVEHAAARREALERFRAVSRSV